MKNYFFLYSRALRVNQWTKNFVIFASILFTGKLFQWNLLTNAFEVFCIFCLLSSTSYVLNDIIDYKYDRKHPVKKYRPLASGDVTIPQATFIVFVFTIASLLLALIYSIQLFILALFFLLLHFFYSLYLKRFPVVDIFTISFSFVLRVLAGVVATGYHVPIWLIMTVFFISLFMATVKRHAELVTHGSNARESLYRYKEHLLYFLSTTFATLTIVSYSLYTYNLYNDPSQQAMFTGSAICQQIYSKPKQQKECKKNIIIKAIPELFPNIEARKLMMITVPFVVYGIARYAQLLYEKEEGERPEKIITTDKPLVITMMIWALVIIVLIYVI